MQAKSDVVPDFPLAPSADVKKSEGYKKNLCSKYPRIIEDTKNLRLIVQKDNLPCRFWCKKRPVSLEGS